MFHRSPLSKLWKSKVKTQSLSKKVGGTWTCPNVIERQRGHILITVHTGVAVARAWRRVLLFFLSWLYLVWNHMGTTLMIGARIRKGTLRVSKWVFDTDPFIRQLGSKYDVSDWKKDHAAWLQRCHDWSCVKLLSVSETVFRDFVTTSKRSLELYPCQKSRTCIPRTLLGVCFLAWEAYCP